MFEGDDVKFAPVTHVFARKILFAIFEGDAAKRYLTRMITSLELSERDKMLTVSMDLVFDFLIASYKMEERRMADQLRERYEMDAAQYGGIVVSSQFQTLVMFSPRKADSTVFCGTSRVIWVLDSQMAAGEATMHSQEKRVEPPASHAGGVYTARVALEKSRPNSSRLSETK
jgi:hypothetical protein